jgi:NAD(P)-dependent dehydrogenase (short-subunit alcohol dehydrogenase family)
MGYTDLTEKEHTSTEDTTRKQQRLQREQDTKDSGKPAKSEGESKGRKPAVQAGHRDQPAPPMPAQHLQKPGIEADMELAPRFQAPTYHGSGKLKDCVALITGGDSGIGRAVAVLMAREGADIAIVYLDEDQDAQDTQKWVEQEEGTACMAIKGDVKDPAFCKNAVAQVMKRFGRLDILVNNAGFQEHAETAQDISEERFDETLRTNVYGYFHMAKAAIPHLPKGGSIINTGSVTGLRGSKELIDYATSKGAIHAFTKSLASNLLSKGIRVNAVAPGPVWTPFNPAERSAQDIAHFGAETDMHRPAQPEEISPAYIYLAAPCCSSYVTGIVLPVTGSVGE